MTSYKHWTRRDFLKCATAAATGMATPGAALGLLAGLQSATVEAATGDYKALVCIFLAGGNDGFNMLIPTDTTPYATYKKARSGLAFTPEQLLNLNATPSGSNYAVSSRTPELRNLYNDGRLAFLANVGTLLEPTTKKSYQAGSNLPPQLYSHNDQSDQGMSTQADALQKVGWGGRIADLYSNINGTSRLPLGVSIGGNNLFQIGLNSVPYYLNTYGVNNFEVTAGGSTDPRTKAFMKMLDLSSTNGRLMDKEYAKAIKSTIDLSQTLKTALSSSSASTVVWPGSYIAQQLKAVAQMISVRQTFGQRRQVFYVIQGGYDTHDDQIQRQGNLLAELSQAMAAFHNAMDDLGVGNNVTSFTLSDFGRTLTSNGDGTDHAWGNVQMVAGGSVVGGNVYGTFPNQIIDGPDDAGYGRLIPTTSIEQYAATLANWFGVSTADLDTIFPHLKRFNSSDLGFMV